MSVQLYATRLGRYAALALVTLAFASAATVAQPSRADAKYCAPCLNGGNQPPNGGGVGPLPLP
jgi:hypothetical protein